MKIVLENLGVLKKAEFELGDLTVICGHNNTGKTYATYALFSFLQNWQRFMRTDISDQEIKELVDHGVCQINITRHIKKANTILQQGCLRYTQLLPRFFASSPKHFQNTQFRVELNLEIESVISPSFDRTIRSRKNELLSLRKSKEDNQLIVSLSADTDKFELPGTIVKEVVSETITEIIFGQYFPNPFIASAERTGVAIFSKELDFARNRLLEEMAQSGKDIDPMELLFKSYNDYALPVKANVDFTRRVADLTKEDSFIVKEHPHILNEFADIIGGEYISDTDNSIRFKPTGKSLSLTMGESSSVVRSMLDIGSYLRHIAKQGDLLIIDEPELSLHPENQRRVARLFAQLVNIGIRVFITTHSDYIIRELNTLIMLNHDQPYLRTIAEREGYQNEELVSPDGIKVYVAEKALVKANTNSKRRSRHQTLVEAEVSPELGIDAWIFDKTINKMNEIQEAIVWGIEE